MQIFFIGESEPADKFIKTLNNVFLIQNIYFKTFRRHSEYTNTLDLVITDNGERVYEIVEESALGNLDNGHIGISWKYAKASGTGGKDKKTRFKRNRYNYRTGDYAGMKMHLGELNWEELLRDKSVQDQFYIFLKINQDICERYLKKVPNQGIKIRSKWMDKDTKAMVRHKANLWQKYIRGGKKRVEIMKD